MRQRNVKTAIASEAGGTIAERSIVESRYAELNQLDGQHPWQRTVPEGAVLYQARILAQGRVLYFNFELAREMGLLPEGHPEELNPALERKLLDTFNLRIINEYDTEHKIRFDPNSVKPHRYMATRYLQLQHSSKSGTTSGDGRSIWNGVVRHRGRTWDVASRGTGVTCLAPGAVMAGRTLRTGGKRFGYGCGTADLDELIGCAILSEIFHRNGLSTERVLVVIDHGDGNGIGVRAAPNLMRPAHLFAFLRQGRLKPLRALWHEFVMRQIGNKDWSGALASPGSMGRHIDELITSFARFTSRLERDYIFHWIDWDGDNLLANAGIIDYGSVRQFGLRHDQYRYDDSDRFSTNLNEQRSKTRLILQQFLQLRDFIETGRKRPLESFRSHRKLEQFDRAYDYFLLDRFLWQCGYPEDHRDHLLLRHRPLVERFFSNFSALERLKSRRRRKRVADGINRPARLNMRLALRRLQNSAGLEAPGDFYVGILARASHLDDRRLSHRTFLKIQRLQEDHIRVLEALSHRFDPRRWRGRYGAACERINRDERLTGNALILIVVELMDRIKAGLTQRETQALMDGIIEFQGVGHTTEDFIAANQHSPRLHRLARTMLTLIDGHREDI